MRRDERREVHSSGVERKEGEEKKERKEEGKLVGILSENEKKASAVRSNGVR